MSGRYVRCELFDLLELDGESLALVPPDQLVRLSPIATLVVEAASRPVSVDSLLTMVVERFGPPPDGDAPGALAEVIDGLVTAGVLERISD